MSEWLSVKDRLPEEETEVLLLYNDGDNEFILKGWGVSNDEPNFIFCIPTLILEFDEAKVEFHATNYSAVDDYVTHWMPLPKPPNEENK